MPNLISTQSSSLMRVPNISRSGAGSYAKVNTNRQTRYEARGRRRWGDWDDFLAIPLPLLWLDEAYAEAALFDVEEAIEAAPIIGLWP
jgi:hypothetical protein